MRNVEAHLLGDKMDEAVSHYINAHQPSDHVHIDTDGMPMAVPDDGSRITIMHQQTYSTHMCRQVAASEGGGEGPWGEELLDPEGRIAALVAHLASSRAHHAPPPQTHHKVPVVRNEVDNSVILDSSIRFNGQTLEQPLVVQLPPLQALPPLQDMKRCPEPHWFTDKNKKNEGQLVTEPGSPLGLAGSPHGRQPSRKSLPHKKRISRKLKRNHGGSTPQQTCQNELVVLGCSEPAPPPEEEQILPDSFGGGQQHHITHEVRPILICQICGEFYGDEQLKFFHHLKQHYEPHTAIIIDNPVADLVMDKMSNTCIVDNVTALPDSIMELSLEGASKTLYQPMDKHILYTTSEKTLTYNNKLQYTMSGMERSQGAVVGAVAGVGAGGGGGEKDLYGSLEPLHGGLKVRPARRRDHRDKGDAKLEDMGEFSEPEDLMAGIHVCVGEYEPPLLPHLTVDSGHVLGDVHARPWYSRHGAQDPCEGCETCNAEYCTDCDRAPPPPPHPHTEHTHTHPSHTATQPHEAHQQSHDTHTHPQDAHVHAQSSSQDAHAHNNATHTPHHQEPQQLKMFKEEVLQRIFDNEVPDPGLAETSYPEAMLPEHGHEHGHEHEHEHEREDEHERKQSEQKLAAPAAKANGKRKRLECGQCGRVFVHRNSLIYHALSHAARQHTCPLCPKTFLTPGALKIHKRVHNGDKPYKCELCGRDFRQWSDLRYHTISLHSNEKHFKCEFCGKEFARKYSLNVHRRIHTGERNYKCDYCSKSFSASSYRLTHMRTHTGDRPYKCDQCEKSFRSSFDLRRHILVHDKVRNRFDEQKPKPKDKKAKSVKEEKPESPKPSKKSPPPNNKKSPKKKSPNKKGAPNVTVHSKEGPFKTSEFPNADEFDRPQFTKFKVVFNENDIDKDAYRDQRDFAVLKPARDDRYRENTDGKMQIFTHVEKKEYDIPVGGSTVLGDIRRLEREVAREVRADLPGEVTENGFLERLTALYNVPA